MPCYAVEQKGAIEFDADLLAVSAKSTEMLVELGQTLGVAKNAIPKELQLD
jgi:hypothetical protein